MESLPISEEKWNIEEEEKAVFVSGHRLDSYKDLQFSPMQPIYTHLWNEGPSLLQKRMQPGEDEYGLIRENRSLHIVDLGVGSQ